VVHSPAACLPGNGWRIAESSIIAFKGSKVRANRLQIVNGDQKALVYYWFNQRGRIIQSEWMVKWHLFFDSVRAGRSDGAMVRIMATIPSGTSVNVVEREMNEVVLLLNPFIDNALPVAMDGID
jgi:EpsI family protein